MNKETLRIWSLLALLTLLLAGCFEVPTDDDDDEDSGNRSSSSEVRGGSDLSDEEREAAVDDVLDDASIAPAMREEILQEWDGPEMADECKVLAMASMEKGDDALVDAFLENCQDDFVSSNLVRTPDAECADQIDGFFYWMADNQLRNMHECDSEDSRSEADVPQYCIDLKNQMEQGFDDLEASGCDQYIDPSAFGGDGDGDGECRDGNCGGGETCWYDGGRQTWECEEGAEPEYCFHTVLEHDRICQRDEPAGECWFDGGGGIICGDRSEDPHAPAQGCWYDERGDYVCETQAENCWTNSDGSTACDDPHAPADGCWYDEQGNYLCEDSTRPYEPNCWVEADGSEVCETGNYPTDYPTDYPQDTQCWTDATGVTNCDSGGSYPNPDWTTNPDGSIAPEQYPNPDWTTDPEGTTSPETYPNPQK